MGVSANGYVGVLVRIKLEDRNYEVSVRSCTKNTCDQYGIEKGSEVRFCPNCGNKIGNITIKETGIRGWQNFVEDVPPSKTLKKDDPLNPYSIYEAGEEYGYEDVLYSPSDYLGNDKEEILIDNYKNQNELSLDIDDENYLTIDQLNGVADQAVADFRKKYESLIDDMISYFGEERVSIDFGVVVYWS